MRNSICKIKDKIIKYCDGKGKNIPDADSIRHALAKKKHSLIRIREDVVNILEKNKKTCSINIKFSCSKCEFVNYCSTGHINRYIEVMINKIKKMLRGKQYGN